MLSWLQIAYAAALSGILAAGLLTWAGTPYRLRAALGAGVAAFGGAFVWNAILRAVHGDEFFVDAPVSVLRMSDGEQVTSMLAVLPETFVSLPATLRRRPQRRLLHVIRAVERDTYLWGREHEGDCNAQRCGPTPEEPLPPFA